MFAALRRVVVRRPDAAFGAADPDRWHYASRPDLERAQQEHDELMTILRQEGAEVHFHQTQLPDHADAVFVHDPALVTDKGAIVLRMGKELRRGEEPALGSCLEQHGVPIHATLHGDATAEGGDLMWIDENTLAVGVGFRTNGEGLRQLREVLSSQGVQVIPFDLPYHHGADSCLHLMSLISVVDHDLAVVFLPLLPVALWRTLVSRGFTLVDVPEKEFATMGPNVLATGPRRCVLLRDNPITAQRLTAAGCDVKTYRGDELSLTAEGGATCLTRPIWRG